MADLNLENLQFLYDYAQNDEYYTTDEDDSPIYNSIEMDHSSKILEDSTGTCPTPGCLLQTALPLLHPRCIICMPHPSRRMSIYAIAKLSA